MKLSRRLIAALRGLVFTLAALATLVALFVVVENWRGDRAWAAVESDLRARGERLELAAYQPKSVPDDQNFFKAPLLVDILYERPDDGKRQRLLVEARLADFDVFGEFRGPRAKDLVGLRGALKQRKLVAVPESDSPARDILAAMAPLHPLLDALRTAAQTRPHAALEARTYPFDPPHLAIDSLFRLAQALGVRAAAHVELRQMEAARADIVTLQRFATELSAPPATLLNVLVGAAVHGIATAVVHDGVRRHAWSDAQLAEFQGRLAQFDHLGRFVDALRYERAATVHLLDSRPKDMARDFQFPRWIFFHGWAQQNKATYSRRLDAEVFSAIESKPARVFPERLVLHSPGSATTKPSRHPYERMASFALSNLSKLLDGYARTTQQHHLDSVSWALERYRVVRGRLPDNLDELVPAFLPAAPIGVLDGNPLRYQPPANTGTSVQLYAVGKNGVDEQGKGDDIAMSGSPES